MLRPLSALALVAALAACQPGPSGGPDMAQRAATEAGRLGAAAEGACWATDRLPPRYERVLEEVVIAPARTDARGRVVVPAVTERREREIMVSPAEDRLFAVPCPETMDAEFVATLQRALAARGHYAGPVHGRLDAATAEAVRRYQAPQGLDSATLSLDAARQLGLVALPRHAF